VKLDDNNYLTTYVARYGTKNLCHFVVTTGTSVILLYVSFLVQCYTIRVQVGTVIFRLLHCYTVVFTSRTQVGTALQCYIVTL